MKTKKKKILEYITVFQEEKEGGYSVWVPELPGCASQGETLEEAIKNIKEAIKLYLEPVEPEKNKNISVDQDYKKQFVLPIKISYA